MTEPSDERVPDSEIRIGDAEREAVLQRLVAAHAAGRLDLAEFDERSAAVVHSRTRGDLAALTADLPAEESAAVSQQRPRPGPVSTGSSAVDATRRRPDKQLSNVLRTALLVVIITNAIWLIGAIGRDSGDDIPGYWPVWPMLGMVIWVAATALSPRDSRDR